jgi:hypothetical protein
MSNRRELRQSSEMDAIHRNMAQRMKETLERAGPVPLWMTLPGQGYLNETPMMQRCRTNNIRWSIDMK